MACHARPWAAVLLFLSLCLSATAWERRLDKVVYLSDATFEHDTQAATGQTTGHWIVIFCDHFDMSGLSTAIKATDNLMKDPDVRIIPAIANIGQNRRTAQRFKLDYEVDGPVALLFRDQKYYQMPAYLDDHERLTSQLIAFIEGGYLKTTPLEVPAPADPWQQLMMMASKKLHSMGLVKVDLSVVAALSGVATLVLVGGSMMYSVIGAKQTAKAERKKRR